MASKNLCLPKKGRMFTCRFCLHPFNSQHRLETHERIHMGNKPHQCPLCYRAFTQAMYLRFHLQQIHGGSQEEAEVMVHSVSCLQNSTVLDAVVDEGNMRTLPFDKINEVQQESALEPELEEGSRTLSFDRGNNKQPDASPEPVGDIMDFAPLFLAEDIPISGMNEIVSSTNLNANHKIGSLCSSPASFSSQEQPDLFINTKDNASSKHLPVTIKIEPEDVQPNMSLNSKDNAVPKPLLITTKCKTKLDHIGASIPRKIRKQQTPQKTIFEDQDDIEGIETLLSSAPQSLSDMGLARRQEKNIKPNDITGIMALHKCISPIGLASNQGHEGVQLPSSLKDTIYQTPSSRQDAPFQDDANHELLPDDQVSVPVDTLEKGNISLTCQSNIHDVQMHSYANQSGAALHHLFETPNMVESNHNAVGHTVLPENPRKKKILTCELCDKTFTGTLFLRSHFRVVHGAEIIGIDSDDDCALDHDETEKTCETDSALKIPMSLNAKERAADPKSEQKRRGRPKGSKNKPKSKESLLMQIANNGSKVRVILKHTAESSKPPTIPKEVRKRGRPPKHGAKSMSVPMSQQKTSTIMANMPHVPSPQLVTSSVINTPNDGAKSKSVPIGQQKTSTIMVNMPHVPSPQSITSSVIDTLMIQSLKFSNGDLEPFIENKLKKEKKNSDELNEAVKCVLCGKEFVRNSDLRRHMRCHTGEKPYTCSTCGRKFGDIAHLKHHEKLHSETKQYECKVCGKRFSQSGGLYSHSRTHENRQYGCKLCSKKFTRKSDVQRHLRTHTDMKPFLCIICHQSFNTEDLLKDHVKLHSEERQFVCSECGMRFEGRNGLHSHYKIHFEKQYECDVCFKKFSQNSAWHRHMKTHNSAVDDAD